jgi:hypothetical protein
MRPSGFGYATASSVYELKDGGDVIIAIVPAKRKERGHMLPYTWCRSGGEGDGHGRCEAGVVTAMSAGSDEVRVERKGSVMTITLDRPADQNRLTRDVLMTLQSVADRLAIDEEVQAVAPSPLAAPSAS